MKTRDAGFPPRVSDTDRACDKVVSAGQGSSGARSLPALIRVVVPVRHEVCETVTQCVSALRQSSIAQEMEIMLADDTEHDDWESFARENGILWRRAGARSSAASTRNAGARGFEGQVLVFVDADVRVEQEAIGLLVAPILGGAAEATVGNYTDRVSGMGFASTYKHLYVATVYGRRRGYLRNEFWTALGAVRRGVFERTGGFAAGIPGAAGEDTEFGCRLTAAGFRVMAVNAARATHLKRFTLRGLVLNDFRKGSMSAALLLAKRVPLTDFRHSSRRDIAAVVLGATLAGWVVFSTSAGLPPVLSSAILAVAGAAYLRLRSDLVRTFSRRGAVFLAGAVQLMWVLDLVRALSIARVAAGLCQRRVAGLLRWAHYPVVSPRPQKHPSA